MYKDYEEFSPRDNLQDKSPCILGHSITYTKRKPQSICFNDETVEPIRSYVNCTCTEDDWEW
jgi:hypothetical protein